MSVCKLVTLVDISEKTGMAPQYIYKFYKAKSLLPVSNKPLKFRASDVNKWLISYGSQIVSLREAASMLQVKWKAFNWLIENHGLPDGFIPAYGEAPVWRRITIMRWRKYHPGYKSLVEEFMRQNK